MLHSLFPQAHCRFLSLPLLGPVADGFDDWLAANGYTRVSRQNSNRMLLHVDAELRRRQVKKLANLTHPVLRGCWRTLRKDRPFSARTVRTLERYLAVNGLIADGQPATGTSPASMLIEEYANYLREVRGFAVSTVSNHRYTVQCFLQHLDSKETALKKIRVPQIESYITKASKRLNRPSLQHDIGALRGFLKGLAGLNNPTVASWLLRFKKKPFPEFWNRLGRPISAAIRFQPAASITNLCGGPIRLADSQAEPTGRLMQHAGVKTASD
jgi:integrase/recombinase XerD